MLVSKPHSSMLAGLTSSRMRDEGLHMDFSCCVTLYKDFVKQSAQTTNAHMITKLEDEYGIDDVVQDEPEMSDEQ